MDLAYLVFVTKFPNGLLPYKLSDYYSNGLPADGNDDSWNSDFED